MWFNIIIILLCIEKIACPPVHPGHWINEEHKVTVHGSQEYEDPDDPGEISNNEESNVVDLNDASQAFPSNEDVENVERHKRLTGNTIKGTKSSYSEPSESENTDYEPIDEGDAEDYVEKETLSTKEMSVANWNRGGIVRESTVSERFAETQPSQTLSSKAGENIKKTHNNVWIKQDLNSISGRKKNLHLKNRKPSSGSTKLKDESSLQDILSELNKSYSELVCAIAKFMSLANKTMCSNNNEGPSTVCQPALTHPTIPCVFRTKCSHTLTCKHKPVTPPTNVQETCETGVTRVNTMKPRSSRTAITKCSTLTSNQKKTFEIDETDIGTMDPGSFIFSEALCTTKMRKAEEGESTVLCEDDMDQAELIPSRPTGEDLNAILKKQRNKDPNNEYDTSEYDDQGDMYVYHEYDSVDPNEELSKAARKPSMSSAISLRTSNNSSIKKSSSKRIDGHKAKGLEMDTFMKDGSDDRIEAENQTASSTASSPVFGTKLKEKSLRKFEKVKRTRKKHQRWKNFPNRLQKEQQLTESTIAIQEMNTEHPMLRNIPINREDDGILEYV